MSIRRITVAGLMLVVMLTGLTIAPVRSELENRRLRGEVDRYRTRLEHGHDLAE